jgi:hypothetical protein
MLPPQVYEKTPSKAERKVFAKIKRELDDSWTVLHSLGFAGHRTKPWAEIDFVLVGPSGVYCLEVKGGRVRREEGMWVFIDRDGEETRKSEGPFAQVGSATAALKNHIFDRYPEARRAPVAWGVVTPDIEWKVDGIDTPEGVVCDTVDFRSPFIGYLNRLDDYWRRWFENRNFSMAGLNESHRSSIVDVLRADFDLRPTLAAQLGLVNDELLRLTEEQYRVLDGLKTNARALIRGGAGTGKTYLALEDARREAATGNRVLLTCHNRRLADLLRGIVIDESGITIRHLHGILTDLIDRAGMYDRLPDEVDSSWFAVHQPAVALDALIELDELDVYDTLIVDEGQDLLLPAYLDFLDGLLSGGFATGRWRVFMDPKQNIFKVEDPNAMDSLRLGNPVNFDLSVNCRNTQGIAIATSLLAATPIDEVLEAEGPEVKSKWYTTPDDQVRLLESTLAELRKEDVDFNGIVILSRRRRENASIPRTLTDGTRLVSYEEADSRAEQVEFSTIATFKGLEKDVVIMVGVDDLDSAETRADLYVGLSRAKGLLIPIIDESQRSAYERLAAELGERLRGHPPSDRA